MANIQPENGTLPIAYALAEAFYKDRGSGLVNRITWWVLRNTYGRRPGKQQPRRKTCNFNWTKIADDIGAARPKVSVVGRWLLDTKRLMIDNSGRIGIQKDPDLWITRVPNGDTPKGTYQMGTRTVPTWGHPTVPKRYASPNAREILAVNPNRGVLPATPPQLPNGQLDTVMNRVALGNLKYDPADLPEWNRMDYKVRDDKRGNWNENCYAWKYCRECGVGHQIGTKHPLGWPPCSCGANHSLLKKCQKKLSSC